MIKEETFKEFFTRTNPDFSHLVNEMSMEVPGFNHPMDDTYENIQLTEYIVNNETSDITFNFGNNVFDVYLCKLPKEDNYKPKHLFFVYGGKYITAQLDFFIQNGGITIVSVWKRNNGLLHLMPQIYITFLLDHFDFILSDNAHTIKGFGLYQYILENKEKFNIRMFVYDCSTGKEQEVHQKSELLPFFGKDINHSNYRFKIYRNK